MQIPRTLIDNYTRGINGLTASAQEGVANVMSQFEFSENVADDRKRIISIMSAALRPYLSIVVPLSCEFYEQVREWSVGSRLGHSLEIDDIYDAEKTDNAVRAFMQKAVDGEPEKVAPLLLERIDYEMKLAAANTSYAMGKKDAYRVKWARVPSGTETCEFCLALAGQGFHYRSEESASVHIHKGCDCRIVPNFGKDTVEGYDAGKYRDAFEKSVQERADSMGISYEEAYERRYGTAARRARRKRSN